MAGNDAGRARPAGLLPDPTAMLAAIGRAQTAYFVEADTSKAFDGLLSDMLGLTMSAYGFIGEVLHTPEGQPYLKTHAITNIAWDAATRRFYAENAPKGMEFFNLKTLFGHVLSNRQPVIANDPAHDPRRGGLPPGHPSLDAFLGIPIHIGDQFVGMAGMANRHGGYSLGLVEALSPLLSTAGNLILARRTRRATQETQSHLQALVNASSRVAIIATDTDGLITVFNTGAERMLGYGSEEMVGRQTPAIIHLLPEVIARGEELSQVLGRPIQGFDVFVEAARQGRSEQREWTYVRKDGSHLTVDLAVSAIQDSEGNITGFLGVASDITARKMAEQDNARLAELVKNSNDFIGIAGLDQHARFLNPAGRALAGLDPDSDISHLRMQDFLTEETRLRLAAEILPVLQQEGSWQGEAQFRHLVSGEPIDVDFNVFLLHDRDTGEPTGFATTSRDITERKRVERMKSEFVSTVSHELRTPLTAIRGALGLMAGGALGVLPDPARDLVGTAYRNSERLTVLINDLLDMEKIAAGQMRFDLQTQPVMPLVEQAIQANQAYAGQFNVRLTLAERLDEAQVNVDGQRFQQVLSNFLSNAVKFSPQDSEVTVRVERVGDQVKVAVQDQGPGIPADFRDRIFQKFSQADASDTRAKGGTGLGLAITRELAGHMGGAVGFESDPGLGAVFHVLMPIAAASGAEA